MKPPSAVAFFFLCTCWLTGCGSNPDAPLQAVGPGTGTQLVVGQVVLGEPVVGAKVQVFDAAGRPLAETVTGPSGWFEVRFPGTADFNLKSTVPGPATLESVHRGFLPNQHFVSLNPASTLVSVYSKKHPELTLDQAEARVRPFLAVHGQTQFGSQHSAARPLFSHTRFLREAQGPGVDTFLQTLVSELESGSQHGFPPDDVIRLGAGNEQSSVIGLVAGFVFENIAAGALNKVGGSLFGTAMNKLGVSFFNDNQAELEALKNISLRLDRIGQQINSLQNSVDDLGKAIRADFAQQQYTILVSSFINGNGTSAKIQGLNRQLLNLANNGTTADPVELQNLTNSIAGTLGFQQQILDLQAGSGSTASAIVSLQSIVITRFFCNAVQGAVLNSQFNQFLGLHETHLNLITSYFTSLNPPDLSNALDQIKQCDDATQRERSLLPVLSDNTVIYDAAHQRLWTRLPAIQTNSFDTAVQAANSHTAENYQNWSLPSIADLAQLGADVNALNKSGFRLDGSAFAADSVGQPTQYYWVTDQFTLGGSGFRSVAALAPPASGSLSSTLDTRVAQGVGFAPLFVSYPVLLYMDVVPNDPDIPEITNNFTVTSNPVSSPLAPPLLRPAPPGQVFVKAWGVVETLQQGPIFTPATDLTNQVFWTSSDDTIARVSNAHGQQGTVTFLQNQPVQITATRTVFNITTTHTASVNPVLPVRTLQSMVITPINRRVPLSLGNLQFSALGFYSDGTTSSLTSNVTWSTNSTPNTFSTTTPGQLSLVSANAQPFTVTAVSPGVANVTTELNISH